jgi:hypothetical protein
MAKHWTLSELALACEIAAKEATKGKDKPYYNPAYPAALFTAASILRRSTISERREGQSLMVKRRDLEMKATNG